MKEKVIHIPYDAKAIFLERINRFTGIVNIYGGDENVKIHIHDSGRLGEILFKGNTVYLRRAANDRRKTKWDLIAGEVEGRKVFVNSMYHRKIAIWVFENLKPFGEIKNLKPEIKFNNSRIDFMVESERGKFLVETKGCTLGENGIALFPDAPTERGKRHLEELITAKEMGYNPVVVFLVFRDDTSCFAPHRKRDPRFTEAYEKALKAGVKSLHYQFSYDGKDLSYVGEIPLCSKF